MSFLQSCVADLQQALRASATGPAGYGTEASQTKASHSKKTRLHVPATLDIFIHIHTYSGFGIAHFASYCPLQNDDWIENDTEEVLEICSSCKAGTTCKSFQKLADRCCAGNALRSQQERPRTCLEEIDEASHIQRCKPETIALRD